MDADARLKLIALFNSTPRAKEIYSSLCQQKQHSEKEDFQNSLNDFPDELQNQTSSRNGSRCFEKEKTADNVKRSIGSEERNDSSCGGDHCLPESFASECSSNVSEIPQQSFHSHEPFKSPFQIQQKHIELMDWSLQFLGEGKIIVEGQRRCDPPDILWRTSLICERISTNAVRSRRGTIYFLLGEIDMNEMFIKNFSEDVIRMFRFGFPVNWRDVFSMICTRPVRKDNVSEVGKATGSRKTKYDGEESGLLRTSIIKRYETLNLERTEVDRENRVINSEINCGSSLKNPQKQLQAQTKRQTYDQEKRKTMQRKRKWDFRPTTLCATAEKNGATEEDRLHEIVELQSAESAQEQLGITEDEVPWITEGDQPGTTEEDTPGITKKDTLGTTKEDPPGIAKADPPEITEVESPRITEEEPLEIIKTKRRGITAEISEVTEEERNTSTDKVTRKKNEEETRVLSQTTVDYMDNDVSYKLKTKSTKTVEKETSLCGNKSPSITVASRQKSPSRPSRVTRGTTEEGTERIAKEKTRGLSRVETTNNSIDEDVSYQLKKKPARAVGRNTSLNSKKSPSKPFQSKQRNQSKPLRVTRKTAEDDVESVTDAEACGFSQNETPTNSVDDGVSHKLKKNQMKTVGQKASLNINKSSSIPVKSKRGSRQKPKNNHTNDDDTICVQRSRSGRLVCPVLDFWKGQRISTSLDKEEISIIKSNLEDSKLSLSMMDRREYNSDNFKQSETQSETEWFPTDTDSIHTVSSIVTSDATLSSKTNGMKNSDDNRKSNDVKLLRIQAKSGEIRGATFKRKSLQGNDYGVGALPRSQNTVQMSRGASVTKRKKRSTGNDVVNSRTARTLAMKDNKTRTRTYNPVDEEKVQRNIWSKHLNYSDELKSSSQTVRRKQRIKKFIIKARNISPKARVAYHAGTAR
ncbi:uncharacterized protein LOC124446132 isoform X2 [Xenia sp. Carnegie-2017]|uniref:uncharacterized protein LOC124446132 isoform X2 n=1 Tax=Xenia sp. Carnegie-2017 TaxID=2897299 RepID=UPI001F04F5E5|nr:uncharacterized protein LOC124446132 isoform X2 [Xenia sp. Carnegie-2017]